MVLTNASGSTDYLLDTQPATTGAFSASFTTPGAIVDGAYNITVRYQDALNNPPAVSNSARIVIDGVTLAPVINAPQAARTYNNPIAVSFTLPEDALNSSVRLTWASASLSTWTLASPRPAGVVRTRACTRARSLACLPPDC